MTEASPCALHPQEAVLGACQRCGDFVCRLCLRGKSLVCFKCSPMGDSPKPDLNVGLRYAFKDPDWLKKMLIGGACFFGAMICFLPMFLLMGYSLRTARRERQQPQTLLPEWDELGDLFVGGFRFWLAQVLPVFMLLFAMFALIAVVVAIAFAAGAAGSSGGGGGQVAAVIGAVGMFGGILVMVALSLAFSLFMPAVHVHFVRTDRITAGLEFREIWRIVSSRFGDYILLFVFHFVVQMMGTLIGELACGVGLLVTIPWMMIVQGYLIGRYAGWLDSEEGPIGAA